MSLIYVGLGWIRMAQDRNQTRVLLNMANFLYLPRFHKMQCVTIRIQEGHCPAELFNILYSLCRLSE
jgi:hypothetical protein